MADIKIPEEEVANLLSAQILASLSEQTQQDMIKAAINHLISAPRGSVYDRDKPKSPLQQAFEFAINRVAHRIADEIIEERGVHEQIKTLFGDLVDKLPDVRHDWELQTFIFRAMLDYLEQKKSGH